MDELAGAAEIAELLGVSRQRVTQLSARDDFPEPVARLAMGQVWRLEDIEDWRDQRDKRLGREH